MKIIVNGWYFVNKNGTGTERFGREILKALDKIVDKGQIILLVPEYAEVNVEFESISVKKTGKARPFLWQQTTLVRFVRKMQKEGYRCVSFTNTFPVLLREGYVVVLDISPTVNKDFYSLEFRLKTNWQTWLQMRKKKLNIITISHFSESEIRRVFKKTANIRVIPLGWEHMTEISADNDFMDRHKEINKDNYVFAMSSLSPNKNFKWIQAAAKANPNIRFVVAGKADKSIFGESGAVSGENIIFLGYVTDSESKFLLENARAFVFPSFYEGFGLPPLEALSCGTPIIISDIPCLREIYGDTAHYIDPNDPNVNIEDLLDKPVADSKTVLERNTWSNAAYIMAKELGLTLRNKS